MPTLKVFDYARGDLDFLLKKDQVRLSMSFEVAESVSACRFGV